MRITALSEWYPEILEAWLDPDVGRRLYVPLSERRGYVVHHTAGGDIDEEYAYARWVARFHFWTRNWRRPGGYSFQIGSRGTIFEMCGWEFVGAHAPGCNYNSIGVAFQGDFTHTLPNQPQLDSFAWLVSDHSVPNVQQGHRDCSDTACPGNTLYRALPLPIEIEPDEPDEPDEDDIMADPEVAKQLARLADASGVRAQAEVSAELAAIRTRAGLAPEPDSDAVWIERIISGERTLADAARAIADK